MIDASRLSTDERNELVAGLQLRRAHVLREVVRAEKRGAQHSEKWRLFVIEQLLDGLEVK